MPGITAQIESRGDGFDCDERNGCRRKRRKPHVRMIFVIQTSPIHLGSLRADQISSNGKRLAQAALAML